MTIPELLVRDQRWPNIHGPWLKPRTFTTATMTINDLCNVCYQLGIMPQMHFVKKEGRR